MSAFARGAHLIITGGEPLLRGVPLAHLLARLRERLNAQLPFVEVETNATRIPSSELLPYVAQIQLLSQAEFGR